MGADHGGDELRAMLAERPVDLGRRTNLLGPPGLVRERISAYRAAGVATLQAKLSGPLDERLATLGTLLELCADPPSEGADLP